MGPIIDCCLTCKYWGPNKKIFDDSLGKYIDYYDCAIDQVNIAPNIMPCNKYEHWEDKKWDG